MHRVPRASVSGVFDRPVARLRREHRRIETVIFRVAIVREPVAWLGYVPDEIIRSRLEIRKCVGSDAERGGTCATLCRTGGTGAAKGWGTGAASGTGAAGRGPGTAEPRSDGSTGSAIECSPIPAAARKRVTGQVGARRLVDRVVRRQRRRVDDVRPARSTSGLAAFPDGASRHLVDARDREQHLELRDAIGRHLRLHDPLHERPHNRAARSLRSLSVR